MSRKVNIIVTSAPWWPGEVSRHTDHNMKYESLLVASSFLPLFPVIPQTTIITARFPLHRLALCGNTCYPNIANASDQSFFFSQWRQHGFRHSARSLALPTLTHLTSGERPERHNRCATCNTHCYQCDVQITAKKAEKKNLEPGTRGTQGRIFFDPPFQTFASQRFEASTLIIQHLASADR